MVRNVLGNQTRKSGSVAIVQDIPDLVAVIKFETRCKSLIISFFHIVAIPSFGYHEDIVTMTGSLEGSIAAVVPLVQQGDVGAVVIGIDSSADVLDGIQTETIDAHADPFIGRFGQGLEAGVAFRHGDIPVVQVRHPVAETSHIIQGFGRDIGEFNLVTAVSGEPHIAPVCNQIHR